MIFRSIEKPPSAEENKIEEESIGGPWDKHYESQFDAGGEKREEENSNLVNPLREIKEGKIEKESSASKLVSDPDLHEEEKKRFKAAVRGSGGIVPEINTLTNDKTWEEYKRKISDIRNTQAEI